MGALNLNPVRPEIMHIDLNSCFAMVEQQARPLLRGRPLGVTNRLSPHCCMIALSYEAKARGAKVGMRRSDVLKFIPDLVVVETDPPKYHFAYQKLVGIMKQYSPAISMKSIDEGIIDFRQAPPDIRRRSLEDMGYEIKQQLREQVGGWVTCNVGIAPNKLLAKVAAGLNKPNGLDYINSENLRQTLSKLELTDLPGIARHYEARLKAYDINTPLEFLDAPAEILHKMVFQSVVGKDWHYELHGYELDKAPTKLGLVGRQYVMDVATADDPKLEQRLAHLSYSTALKLRYNRVCARGIYVYARFKTGDYWYQRKMYPTSCYTDAAVYRRARELFMKRPPGLIVKEMGVSCYGLSPSIRSQLSLLESQQREEWLTEAVDTVNQRYGIGTVTFANALGMHRTIKQKIPFGSTKYFELLCRGG